MTQRNLNSDVFFLNMLILFFKFYIMNTDAHVIAYKKNIGN